MRTLIGQKLHGENIEQLEGEIKNNKGLVTKQVEVVS